MRVLILGASGMLGHKLLQRLAARHEVVGTVRDADSGSMLHKAIGPVSVIGGVRAEDLQSIEQAIRQSRAEVVLNCIGIVKQSKDVADPINTISVNALLPHLIARVARMCGAKVVQFSTDCVFSGRRGNYIEDDTPDPEDLYGRTKLLGELDGSDCLTIRTSIIGRELRGHLSLIDWLLLQKSATIRGYDRALYTGFTTIALADVVAWLIEEHPCLQGIWHVSSDPISKYELLRLVGEIYGSQVEIERDRTFVCDRRLDSTRFRQQTRWKPPPWGKMIRDMWADATPYKLEGELG